MTFLSPIYLWGLLSILPLAAIYLLKVKPTRQSTNTWFLWQKVFEEKQNSALFSKMRHLLSLLLMILTVCAIFFSLAQPRFGAIEQSDLIIVIDSSASMATLDGGSSRLDRAKSDAHQQVRSLHGSQRAVIVSVDSDVHFHTHLSRNTHELHQAIDAIQQTSLALSPSAIRVIANSLNSPDESSTNNQVILFTDGCSQHQSIDLSQISVRSYFHDTQNVGIVNADIQSLPGAGDNARCMVQLASSAEKALDLEIEITHAETGAIGKLSKLRIEKGLNPPHFFDIPNAQSGQWLVKLLHEDALDSDNLAHLYLQPLISIPVSTSAQNSYFYQRCLEAFTRTGGSLSFTENTQDSLLTLCHQAIPADAPSNVMVFAPKGESPYWSNIGNEISVGIAIKKEEQHPALRHLDCNQLSFSGSVKLKAPTNAHILIEADDGTPLLYTTHSADRNVVVVNLDPEIDNFYLSPWFPVIIYDLATFLSGTDQNLASSYSSGELFLPSVTDSSTIISPDGEQIQIDANQSVKLDQLGAYSIQNAKQKSTITSSLYSTEDSLQTASSFSSKDNKNILQASPSYWLIILALIILVVESLLYHRRKAG